MRNKLALPLLLVLVLSLGCAGIKPGSMQEQIATVTLTSITRAATYGTLKLLFKHKSERTDVYLNYVESTVKQLEAAAASGEIQPGIILGIISNMTGALQAEISGLDEGEQYLIMASINDVSSLVANLLPAIKTPENMQAYVLALSKGMDEGMMFFRLQYINRSFAVQMMP